MDNTIDENQIRESVTSRSYSLSIREDWMTPGGRARNAPFYETTIENEYLGATKDLKARSPAELQAKAKRQIEIWGR
jgi:hypothetical protein